MTGNNLTYSVQSIIKPKDVLMLAPNWLEVYPALNTLEDETAAIFARSAAEVNAPAGHTIFAPGDPCEHWFMVLKGSARVLQITSAGREIVICRMFAGKTCIVSALAAMAGDPHATRAVTNTALSAVALPTDVFHDLIKRSERFREFVFSAYNTEILGLMGTIEEVAHGRIDSRLATCLLQGKREDDAFYGTHEDLASELGTAREVITRQLRTFEERGWVKTKRGSIALRDPSALRQISTHRIS